MQCSSPSSQTQEPLHSLHARPRPRLRQILYAYTLLCMFNKACLSNDRNNDFTRILQLCFNFSGNIVTHLCSNLIIYLVRAHHYSHLSSCLNGISAFNTAKGSCYTFEFFKSFNIFFQGFSSCSWSSC